MRLEKVVAFQWKHQPIAYHRVVNIPQLEARARAVLVFFVVRLVLENLHHHSANAASEAVH